MDVVQKNVMSVMGLEGDTKTIWDKDKPDEVDAAKIQFDALKKKGYLAFKVDDKGEKGELMREFDPNAQKVIMSPPVIGG